jgi:hypothetical protein
VVSDAVAIVLTTAIAGTPAIWMTVGTCRTGGVQPLPISFDNFFAYLSVLTTFVPELSEFHGQNR